jgi:hypothetical protein
MTPRTHGQQSQPPTSGTHVAPDDEAICKALARLDHGEGVELTADELRHWAETGEWPERLG